METKQIYIIDNKEILLNDDYSKFMWDKGLYVPRHRRYLCYEEKLRELKTVSEMEQYLETAIPKKFSKVFGDNFSEDKPYTGYTYDYFTGYDEVARNEHGNLKSYQYYIHGGPIGIRVHFYPNGNLKRITHDIFLHDRFGIMFEWYEDGILKYEGYSYYIYRHYDENGELVLEKKHLENYEKRFIDSIEKQYNEKINERYFELGDREPCTLNELFEEASQNGAEIRAHIPDILPDNMNPPNAIREPVSLRKF